jgi:gluconokinase
VAKELAARWSCIFIESDDLHSASEIEKMASGHPLDDEDRLPWLQRVGERIRDEQQRGRCSVTSCSALKRAYRDILREFASDSFFVMLEGPIDVVRARMETRHHFMPVSLLESQYESLEKLEPDESGISIDLTAELATIVREITTALDESERSKE